MPSGFSVISTSAYKAKPRAVFCAERALYGAFLVAGLICGQAYASCLFTQNPQSTINFVDNFDVNAPPGTLLAMSTLSVNANCFGTWPYAWGGGNDNTRIQLSFNVNFSEGVHIKWNRGTTKYSIYYGVNGYGWYRIGIYPTVEKNNAQINFVTHRGGAANYSFASPSSIDVNIYLFKGEAETSGGYYGPNEAAVGDRLVFDFVFKAFEYYYDSYGATPSLLSDNALDASVIFHINSLASPPPPPQPPTCTTPNVSDQTLDDAFSADFPSLNTTAKPKYFSLQFYNCQNLSKIRYRVNPVGTSPNAAQGLLPSSPNTGLAVQVSHAPSGGSYVPVNLGSWRDINTSGNAYSVPMRVEYYRTGTLSPGNVNSSMTINIEYQ